LRWVNGTRCLPEGPAPAAAPFARYAVLAVKIVALSRVAKLQASNPCAVSRKNTSFL
jgi:hypothetical protein